MKTIPATIFWHAHPRSTGVFAHLTKLGGRWGYLTNGGNWMTGTHRNPYRAWQNVNLLSVIPV